jgi:hypothetical protein
VINTFNRVIVVLLWLLMLAAIGYMTIFPDAAISALLDRLSLARNALRVQQEANDMNYLIGQVAVGTVAVFVFGSLLWLELWPHRQRGVRMKTMKGSSVELDTDSIARRLTWHLDQLADVITVFPDVKSRGNAVDIELEVETAPDIDVPMKTDEVVESTRDIIEEDMGLRLGKLDVRMRHLPFEDEWEA